MFIVWVLPIWRRSGFKKLDSKTLGCSIQSFFVISGRKDCPIVARALRFVKLSYAAPLRRTDKSRGSVSLSLFHIRPEAYLFSSLQIEFVFFVSFSFSILSA